MFFVNVSNKINTFVAYLQLSLRLINFKTVLQYFMMRCIIYVLFLVFFSVKTYAQCGISQSYNIVDLDNGQADTTNVSLIITGALNNNLASLDQGVCGVSLKFNHPFVKELFIELISPAGEKITLVGGNITAYNSPLITWDILFVPCGGAANPDPGFADVWENDQDWLSLSTYTGQYYPHTGCLEDFDIGTVNGTWTLRCIDFADFGQGKLLDFELIFCDDQGLSCGECKLDAGNITNNDITACENDPALALSINKLYEDFPANSNIYEYKNVIFKDGNVFEYSNTDNLTGYTEGSYTICGLQYVKGRESILPAIGTVHNSMSMDEYFFTNGYCAAVSDSCMVVNISSLSAPTALTEYICSGTNYTINGQNYSTA
jgi:hypothetical protein